MNREISSCHDFFTFIQCEKMLARCVIQLSYGIIGILAYLLVFYAMFGVRNILSRNFIVIFTLMGLTVIFYYFF